jgi:putative membrane protein
MKTNKNVRVAILSATVAAIATSSVAQVGEIPARNNGYGYGHDMMWGGAQWGGFGMILGPIFMILILVGIIAAVIYVLRIGGNARFGANGGSHQTHDRALAILKERYAKGEIDSKEFDERKKQLAD